MGHTGSKEDIEFVNLVGKGFFGEVYKAKYRGNNIKSLNAKEAPAFVAVKQVNKSLIAEYNLEQQLRREIDILKTISHPNVIKLYFAWEDEHCHYIVMEFVESNLFEELRNEKKFEPEKAVQFFVGVVNAVKYLHEHQILHRDIKPENILVSTGRENGGSAHTSTDKKIVKIADFGWSNVMSQSESIRSTFCGTLDYLAPEMIRSSGHTFSVDVWSLGILLYELLSGKSPFGAQTQEQTCVRILKLDLKWPQSIPEEGRDLIKKLLKVDPKERLALADIYKHPFIMKNIKSSSTSADASSSNPVADSCSSIESRRLNKCIKVLEQEVQIVLKSKAGTEEKLLSSMDEVEALMCELKKERRLRKKIEEEKSMSESEMLHEISKLKSEINGLQSNNSSDVKKVIKGNESGSTLSGNSSGSGGLKSMSSSDSSSSRLSEGAASQSSNKFRNSVINQATERFLEKLRADEEAAAKGSKTQSTELEDSESNSTSAAVSKSSFGNLSVNSSVSAQSSSKDSTGNMSSDYNMAIKMSKGSTSTVGSSSAQSEDMESYLARNNPILMNNTIM